jgi:hypothetical protein
LGHGGKRPGAGAKPRAVAEAKKDFYGSLLTPIERRELWRKYLFSEDNRTGLSALTYITDREEGKAAQSLKHSGPEGDDPVKVMLIGSKGEHAIQ